MKHFIRLRLKNLTAIGLSLCMAATFAVPFFAYPDQLMADTQDDLDAVNKQLEELINRANSMHLTGSLTRSCLLPERSCLLLRMQLMRSSPRLMLPISRLLICRQRLTSSTPP